MAANRERLTSDLPFFGTQMNFSGPVQGRARVDAPNWANTNMALQPYDLRIHDARPILDQLSLDREGFTLVDHDCDITDAFDVTADGPGYHAAVAEMLGGLTGASFVLPQGKGMIKRSMAGTETETGPARWVHMDYTTAAAYKWVEWIEGWEGVPLRHYPRFAVYQTWRCLTPPPSDNTIAFCDASSLRDDDCIVFDACLREPYDEPGNSFESQFAMFNPAQRWYYFSDLTPGELIIFKGFDSDPARDAQPPHNSADLPGAGAAPRVSVEARFFAFFAS
jgi:hypothetical protein